MTFLESSSRSRLLLEHDLFRKPVSTFRDHALVSDFPGLSSGRGPSLERPRRQRKAFGPSIQLIASVGMNVALAPKQVGRKENSYAKSVIFGSVLGRRLAETSAAGNSRWRDLNHDPRLQLGRVETGKHRQGDGAE